MPEAQRPKPPSVVYGTTLNAVTTWSDLLPRLMVARIA